jgi:predicted lipid-binding transport protein (Tim44 family)
MPGEGLMRRVILIKVCLAVLWLGFSTPALAGGGAGGGAAPNLSALQASASPSLNRKWSPRSRDNSAEHSSPQPVNNSPQRYQGLLKFFAGGLLGGMLVSLLFGYPLSLYWSHGHYPFGFLDLVALTAFAYLGYRLLRPVRPKAPGIPIPGFQMPANLAPPVFTIKNEAGPGLAKISHLDRDFNLPAFMEYARQVIFSLHDAWNHEDLEKIKGLVTLQMFDFLHMGLKLLVLRGEISRVEDLALNQIMVAMARQTEDRDLITVSFQGRVVDYLLERHSFKLVSGSMTYPERLQECWVFERPRGQGVWVLADIQDSRVARQNEAA